MVFDTENFNFVKNSFPTKFKRIFREIKSFTTDFALRCPLDIEGQKKL